jgi:hypothetical protein
MLFLAERVHPVFLFRAPKEEAFKNSAHLLRDKRL